MWISRDIALTRLPTSENLNDNWIRRKKFPQNSLAVTAFLKPCSTTATERLDFLRVLHYYEQAKSRPTVPRPTALFWNRAEGIRFLPLRQNGGDGVTVSSDGRPACSEVRIGC